MQSFMESFQKWDGEILINFIRQDKFLKFLIRDNGIGFDSTNNKLGSYKSTHGISIAKQRIAILMICTDLYLT